MGLDNIPTRATGQTILDEFFNVLKRVLGGDFVPRNISGIPQADLGHLGTEAYKWKRAHITTGYFVCGMVIPFHDFNGELTPGQGWMKCNGDQVNQANYDAIHGAGAWLQFIGGSPIEDKYLPDMNNKYPVGKATTPQDGVAPITSEGAANHQITSSNHVHTGPSHTHQWYQTSTPASGLPDRAWDAAGNIRSIQAGGSKTIISSTHLNPDGTTGAYIDNQWTSSSGTGNTGASGSETLNVKPESHAFQYWMRIV